jgi:DNA polymerase III delta prime subunit
MSAHSCPPPAGCEPVALDTPAPGSQLTGPTEEADPTASTPAGGGSRWTVPAGSGSVGGVTTLPVVWLHGPPGVGKSSAAWALFEHRAWSGSRCGYVDIDQLSMVLPRWTEGRATARLTAANLATVIDAHRAAGAELMIVSGILLPSDVPIMRSALAGRALCLVELRSELAELRRRVGRRDGSVEDFAEIEQHVARLNADPFADIVVDTTTRSPAEVADAVSDAVTDWTSVGGRLASVDVGPDRTAPDRAAPDRAGSDHRVEVLLLTGPRGVGLSTVGWELFQLAGRQRPTAFLDLAQLGFLCVDGDLTVRHDRLRAASLAGVVRNFATFGRRLVIAVGAVSDRDALDHYAAALSPTRVAWCRLRADESTLRSRITTRTTTFGGPHLAGDDLRGGAASDVARVLRRSLSEAASLDASGIGDLILDTDRLTAAESARAVWSAVGHEDGPRW